MGATKHIPRSTKKLEKAVYKMERMELREEQEALAIHNYTKTGVHNCPHKDAGTTHPHRARCFKLKHCGYCPVCGNICPWDHGCRVHGLKQNRLLAKCPSDEQKQAYRFNREGGAIDNDGDGGSDEGEDTRFVSINTTIEPIEEKNETLHKSREKT